ncbi:ABC transporter permease [Phytohabitans rumicis]|uniref:Exporter of polyketide antibiotics n=1 Tax=Phytohabitans rumicis TaxID=1076125 RepID=A0A6V8LCU5_9ACTN|nr:anibiotic ABC transporter [Phytohabitans rumicis]GFJ91896.1 exporter of polyketide antibiotics [Phytohabitans rumicis]
MSAYTGTARLARLAVRRDRVQLPLWILGTTLMLVTAVSAAKSQYPTEADRVEVLRTVVDNPTILIFRAAPTEVTVGAVAMFQILTFLAVLAGFMSTLAVVRHTRQNEETGRSELVGATVVGRRAGLTAALVVVAGANAVLGMLLALVLIGYGLPAAGAVAAGAAVGVTGLAFAGIAAVAAQVTQTSRAANGIAAAVIGLAYFLRGFADAFGDVQANGYSIVSAWPSWLSPIGWTEHVRPFAGDRWWVLAFPLVFFAACVGVAFALTARRDVGIGMIPARPGPATGRPALLSPLGLAWRLQRGTLIGWAVGVAVLGATVGSVGETVEQAFLDNEGAANTIEKLAGGAAGSLADTYFAAMMGIFGALTAGYVVQALLRLRSEETGAGEAVLATATGRLRWLGSHLAIAVGGAAVLLLLAGVSTGLVYGVSTGDTAGKLADMTGAAVVQLPAALIFAGFAVAAFGLLPRLSIGLAWAALALSLILGQLGDLLNLPQAVRDLSPFAHVPALPAAEASAGPMLALAAVALALAAAGLALFRRRDLAT